MDDTEWERIVTDLTANDAGNLVGQVRRDLVETTVARDTNHPLARLFLEPEVPSVRLTANAVARIANWLGSERGAAGQVWWQRQLKLLTGEAASAAGALAEIRALGAALPTPTTIGGGLKIAPHSAAGRAADFRIDADGDEVFVEVLCARMNQFEKERIEWVESVEAEMITAAQDAAVSALGSEPASNAKAVVTADRDHTGPQRERHQVSASAMRRQDGGHFVLTTAAKCVRPYGEPGPDGDAQTLARRLAGKKLPGQVPAGKAGILWMDLSDPDWAMRVKDTLPIDVFQKGLNLGTTHGIWHSFYGREGVTPMMDRHAIAFDFGGVMVTPQLFDGRFQREEQRCWSAAVLRCIDGIVIFEHPSPNVFLPMKVLRELIDMDGYAPYASVHRFDNNPEAVSRRLGELEKMLAFYAA